jgi:hypothetical protein
VSLLFLWQTYGEQWELFEKVSFDGPNRRIIVNENVTALSVRDDIYSAWIRWLEIDDNTKYRVAMRFSGADPIPGGETGVTFFLTNGWKLIYDANIVRIDGVLYSDDFDTPFWSIVDKPIYPATVSALVNTAVTIQNVISGTALTEQQTANAVWQAVDRTLTDAEVVWQNPTRTLTAIDAPTKEDIANQIRIEIAAELAKILEIAKLHGLMVESPLVVTPTTREAGDIQQTITTVNTTTTVQRV